MKKAAKMPSEGFRRHRGPKRRQPETDKPPFPGITALSEKMEKPAGKPCRPSRCRNQRNTRTPRCAGCRASPKYGNRRSVLLLFEYT
ncbi:histidinol phosphate phosphatase [Neisseria meningitidis]|nr:histidinol phosphate phosphatase [Neisseria meningitidis]RQK79847.1 histidinol phosphate phosphatase [Neisseria meningitidis]